MKYTPFIIIILAQIVAFFAIVHYRLLVLETNISCEYGYTREGECATEYYNYDSAMKDCSEKTIQRELTDMLQ